MNHEFIKRRLLLLSVIIYQTISSPIYSQDMVTAFRLPFSQLDSTKIPTNLIDLSPNFSNLDQYASTNDTVLLNRADFFQCVLDLNNASLLNSSQNRVLDIDSVINSTSAMIAQNQHPVAFVVDKISMIPDTVFTNSSLTYDSSTNRIIDNGFNYQFQEKEIVLASVLNPMITNDTLHLSFSGGLSANSNLINAINVQVSQANYSSNTSIGNTLVIPLNLSANVTDVDLLVTVVTETGKYYRKIQFKRQVPVSKPDVTINNPFVSATCELNAPYGYGEAQANVLWSDPQKGKITKPVIIVEGYDPSPIPYGAINWATLQTGMSYNEDGKSVYPQLKEFPQLISSLTNNGYDIIYINFKNSSERIEKNAAILAKFIQYIKWITQSDEEITLMAASMGGLISQTALNILKSSNCPVCVKSYFSFDAPYHGAYVPDMVQAFVKFSYEALYSSRIDYEFKLNTYSAKQMLYTHINDNGERASWLNYFSTLDKHIASSNYAILSSTNDGQTYGFSNGDILVKWQGWTNAFNIKVIDITGYATMRSDNKLVDLFFPNKFYKILGHAVPRSFLSKTLYNSKTPSYFYENVPGSSSNYINNVLVSMNAKKNSFNTGGLVSYDGPKAPKGIKHCFVPSVSALDYYDRNPLANLTGVSPNEASNDHPFDGIYFEPSQNLQHVTINTGNINYLIDHISDGSQNTPATLPLSPFTYFNHASGPNMELNSCAIYGTGVLAINEFQLSNFGNLNTDHFPTSQKAMVRTGNCEDAHIECYANGKFIIGGTNPSNQFYKADVIFRSGSSLEIFADGELFIRDGSSLIIEEGATLIYHKGAKIHLEGESSNIDLRGILEIEDGAVFTFDKGTASRGGFLRVQFGHNTSDHIHTLGPNCKILLQGDISFRDKVLVIGAYTDWVLPSNIYGAFPELQEFRVENAWVEFENEGTLNGACPIYLDRATFQQNTAGTGTGLMLHGQSNLTISNSTFNNFRIGLKAYNNDLQHDLSIQNNRFFQCEEGIHVIGQSFNATQGTLSNCGTGIIIDAGMNSTIDGVEFIYNNVGFEPLNFNNHVRFQGAWFYHNETGIEDLLETPITLECTPFEYNTIGIHSNGKINMSPSYRFPGQTLGGGNNTFFNNIDKAILLDITEIHLSGGENNFMTSNQPVPFYIMGTLISTPIYIPNNLLDVSGNYFDNIGVGGISGASGQLYLLFSYGGASTTGAPVLLNGILLNSMNTQCFNFPRIYPDFKSEVSYTPPVYSFGENSALSNAKVYPNPTKDYIDLKIKAQKYESYTVHIYDLQGKEIYSEEFEVSSELNQKRIHLKSLMKPGIYFVKLSSRSGEDKTFKINLNY
ncbi:MAG: T9SS type A sorting domain-containing protein [Bacteroidetes bacterium]|nr:T9SS type A sorting domain-containing protein [Bacteroidota bacterium]